MHGSSVTSKETHRKCNSFIRTNGKKAKKASLNLLRGTINAKRRIRSDKDHDLLLEEMNNSSIGQKLVESHGTSLKLL